MLLIFSTTSFSEGIVNVVVVFVANKEVEADDEAREEDGVVVVVAPDVVVDLVDDVVVVDVIIADPHGVDPQQQSPCFHWSVE